MSNPYNEYIIYHDDVSELEDLMIATLKEHSARNKDDPGRFIINILKQSFFQVGDSYTYNTLVEVVRE